MPVPPVPFDDPITVRKVGKREEKAKLTDVWEKYFTEWAQRLGASSQSVGTVDLTDQSAAISATNIPISEVATGLYRVSYYARVTQAATTSSSLTVTLQWTDTGVSCTQSGAAMTGNTTATFQGGTVLAFASQATPIRYSTAYASVGATSMEYKLLIVVEGVG